MVLPTNSRRQGSLDPLKGPGPEYNSVKRVYFLLPCYLGMGVYDIVCCSVHGFLCTLRLLKDGSDNEDREVDRG